MANGDLLNISISGLRTSQRVLATIGHNISNVNTDGYSRQEAELSTRDPQFLGNGFLGKGVEVVGVNRQVDAFLNTQVLVNTSSSSKQQVLFDLSSQVDKVFANEQTGLTPALQSFFNGLQELADDPSSIPARQVLKTEAETFVARFHEINERLSDLNLNSNQRLDDMVSEVNSLADAIARLNRDISQSPGIANGIVPNDLLDQRDALLNDLSELVGFTTINQQDGAVNVLIGNGQTLVVGNTAQTLATVPDPLDSSRKEVAFVSGGASFVISNNLRSGEIGGVLDFRDDVLDPAVNGLGRLAVVVGSTINAQHRDGMDLDGQLGGDFFVLPSPRVVGSSGNTGTLTVAYDPAAVGNLSIDDYQLDVTAGNLLLTNLSSGAVQTLGAIGSGPFSAEGLIISEGVAAVNGDRYRLEPMQNAARDLRLNITDTSKIAAAAPIKGSAALANTSDAVVSGGEVLDVTNVNLLNSVNLVFNSATTFQVNGAGASIAYTSGANIDLNGWRVQITGTPQNGDTFSVQSNAGGVGDNRNALQLSALQITDILENGTTSYQGAYSQMIAIVGTQTRQAEISSSALGVLKQQSIAARSEVSGVNLDEEAARLLQFQQSYQASAQAISIANTIFETLLSAVR